MNLNPDPDPFPSSLAEFRALLAGNRGVQLRLAVLIGVVLALWGLTWLLLAHASGLSDWATPIVALMLVGWAYSVTVIIMRMLGQAGGK